MTAISLAVAFLAGIVSFASPCCLPLVPAYVTYMVGTTPAESASARQVALRQALAFVLGFTVVFVGLWASVGLVGYLFRDNVGLVRQVGGAVLIVMGLHVAGLVNIPALYRQATIPADRVMHVNRAKDGTLVLERPKVARSVLLGVVFAAGWTPCIGPILGGIIGLASLRSSVGQGAVLLLVYAVGLGVPFVLVALGASTVSRRLEWFRRHESAVNLVTGGLLVVVGFLMITNLLVKLAAVAPSFGL